MANILIINGHPNPESFSQAMADTYANAARADGLHQVTQLDLHRLTFDLVLHQGYQQRTPLSPDLTRAMHLLKSADHTVWVYPVWWGSMPALLKGFIDRVFLPGHFFQFETAETLIPTRLMQGKTARVLYTMDAPLWYDRWVYGRPAYQVMKRVIMEYCGYRVKFTGLGQFKFRSAQDRAKHLARIERIAKQDATKLNKLINSPLAA